MPIITRSKAKSEQAPALVTSPRDSVMNSHNY